MGRQRPAPTLMLSSTDSTVLLVLLFARCGKSTPTKNTRPWSWKSSVSPRVCSGVNATDEMKPTAILMKAGFNTTCRVDFGGFVLVDSEPIEDASRC